MRLNQRSTPTEGKTVFERGHAGGVKGLPFVPTPLFTGLWVNRLLVIDLLSSHARLAQKVDRTGILKTQGLTVKPSYRKKEQTYLLLSFHSLFRNIRRRNPHIQRTTVAVSIPFLSSMRVCFYLQGELLVTAGILYAFGYMVSLRAQSSCRVC
jgi:hypothetical protein